ncbi:MAG TPA: DUF882 domain-containing protein [Polyangiaceae bacterium]|jgi:uncharacterized protein YcbK (DUF882 family)
MKIVSLFLVSVLVLAARDAPAHAVVQPRMAIETPLTLLAREARTVSWADQLAPLEVDNVVTGSGASIRLYASGGDVDDTARMQLEHVVARDGEQHVLEVRLEQLVVKAAYHFKGARVLVVSGWREHAGRHTTGEALDFKLQGVRAATLAAYLRGLARVGVGVYTHPRTQYVHLDVREPSYHWIDGSPPGVTWKESQLRDPWAWKRDAAWTPVSDLPL